jgi:hypothetical protein
VDPGQEGDAAGGTDRGDGYVEQEYRIKLAEYYSRFYT